MNITLEETGVSRMESESIFITVAGHMRNGIDSRLYVYVYNKVPVTFCFV